MRKNFSKNTNQLVEKPICPRSGLLKSVFCPGSAGAKNTSIPTSVRFGGVADKTCAQLGCFVGKVPAGLFRRSDKYPYLSIDHLKMGLIRSGITELTPLSDDDDLTEFLWKIVREMIKTAVENRQNLVVEGCYIPFDWQKDFTRGYLENIRYFCLVMSENYIRNHFADIKGYANVIESRPDDEYCTLESVLEDNARVLALAQQHGQKYVLIDDGYRVDVDL